MPITFCERVSSVAIVVDSGRVVAVGPHRCRNASTQIKSVIPPHPEEKAFQVEVCDTHANEIVEREPLDEDSVYTWCNDCKYYADPTTGKCGC